MILNPGVQIMARIAQEAWWKIAAKKAAEAAVKLAASEAAKRAAALAAEQGILKIFKEKSSKKSLKRSLKKLNRMLRKGHLRPDEYEKLRKQLIEETAAADI